MNKKLPENWFDRQNDLDNDCNLCIHFPHSRKEAADIALTIWIELNAKLQILKSKLFYLQKKYSYLEPCTSCEGEPVLKNQDKVRDKCVKVIRKLKKTKEKFEFVRIQISSFLSEMEENAKESNKDKTQYIYDNFWKL